MSARPDPDLAIAAWLQGEARDGAPERLVADTRRRIQITRQRRRWWPAWRFNEMNSLARGAIAAAAVVVAAILGFSLIPGSGIGRPGATPTPTPVPTLAATPIPLPSGLLEPGAYSWPTGDAVVPVRFSFMVPGGWGNAGWGAIERGSGTGVVVSPWTVLYTYGDPCRWMTSVVDPGPTVQGLVDALRQQAGRNPTAPVPVTIDGRAGQQIELDVPTDMDPSRCDGREYRAWVAPGPGVTGTAVDEPSRAGLQPGLHSVLTILDVDGTRLVIEASYPAGASAAIRSEVLSVVESIQFGP